MARKKPPSIESTPEVEAFGASSTSRVEVWTDRHRIVGDLHVPTFGEGAKWRVSDVLNQREKSFLSLSNVSVYASNGRRIWQGAFLAVNKNSIILLKALKE
jgi:hypothetical protein